MADDDISLPVRGSSHTGGSGGGTPVTPQFGRGSASDTAAGYTGPMQPSRPLLHGGRDIEGGVSSGAADANSDTSDGSAVRRVAFATLVGLLLAAVAVVIYVTVAARDHDDGGGATKPSFTFDDIFDPTLRPAFAGVAFHPFDLAYAAGAGTGEQHSGALKELAHAYTEWSATTGDLQLVRVNLTDGARSRTTLVPGPALIVDPATNTTLQYSAYTLSYDARFVMFATAHQKLYRHSSYDVYRVWNVTAMTWVTSLTPGTTAASGAGALANGQALRLALWSPASHHIAYVLNNNIFVVDLDGNATSAGVPTVRTVTTDGAVNAVLNGVCDWVYEEEVFSATAALWWALDGSGLAFLRFEESRVATYEFPQYALPYNTEFVYRYPKAGFNGSVVTLGVHALSQPDSHVVWADFGSHNADYFAEVDYFNYSSLVVRTIPRLQNSFQVFRVDSDTGVATPLSSRRSDYWVDPLPYLTFVPLNPAAPTTTPANSWAPLGFYVDIVTYDNFNHLGLFDAASGALVSMITSGAVYVESISGFNARTSTLYYIGTENVGPLSRAAWSVSLAPAMTAASASALSPASFPRVQLLPRSAASGIAATRTVQSLAMSADAELFVINERSDAPGSALYTVGDNGQQPRLLATLASNSAVADALNTRALPTQRFFSFPSSVPNMPALNAYALFPPAVSASDSSDDLCGDDGAPYPVLIYVYGGPGAPQVSTSGVIGSGGNNGWHTYLSSAHGVVVLVVDGVGTQPALGDAFLKNATYGHLGVNEARDVQQAVAWLHTQCWADPSRIALWGWSFGGFLTSMVVGLGQPLTPWLRAAISVAPVTDWRLYDSVYTERYMRTPAQDDNARGYNASSVLSRVPQIALATGSTPGAVPSHGTDYFLIHGTADDNVHFQNSALLVKALVEANVQFGVMYYPNRDHSLTGPHGETNRHLYRLLTTHLMRALGLDDTI